jgi:FlaA1/EpsC-like NDP-sugar epimerase
MNVFMHYFSNRYLSRWVILLFDLALLPVSYVIAYLLWANFDLSRAFISMNVIHFSVIIPVFLFYFWKSKSYSGILRHSNIEDINRIITVTFYTCAVISLLTLVFRVYEIPGFINFPLSVIIIMNLIVATGMVFSRLMTKTVFQHFNLRKTYSKTAMIFGAGQLGQITYNALKTDTSENIEIIGFIEDDDSFKDRYVFDIPIYSVKKAFEKIIPENEVSEIILAIERQRISVKRKKEIAEMCINNHLTLKEVPAVKNWINGELHFESIRKINILDLLEREAITLDTRKIEEGLRNSVVLVTGAAGSIGSELVRQLIGFHTKQVILLDNAESDLYNLQQEIIAKKTNADFRAVIGDVTNKTKLRKIFQQYSPDIVYNAAAYKHVPLMEEFPGEAVRVNVGGTKNLADIAVETGVKKFVLISTDKAVNPSNVMGATKRISEIYVQSLSQSGMFDTQFITTRFGNVLDSNGSVIPLFEKQIKMGGPLTVTHKDITRYFMTIPEAVQLVLEAGFIGKGGEIFVFDMGEPVKIYDLARKMISLSGLVPDKDIMIEITGLRPGEKLYEELLDHKEELLPTYNEKIMVGKVIKHEHGLVDMQVTELLNKAEDIECSRIVEFMMNIIPEYIPLNSVYANGSVQKEPFRIRPKMITYHTN